MTHLKTMRVQFADAQTSSGTRGGTREFVPSEVTNSTLTLEGQVHYEKEFGQVFFFLGVRPHRLVPAKAHSHFKHITLNTQRLPTAIRWNIWK